MKTEAFQTDGRIYHQTEKNRARPVKPSTQIPPYFKRFRGRIELRDSAGNVVWANHQKEVGIQGFRVIRAMHTPESGITLIRTQ